MLALINEVLSLREELADHRGHRCLDPNTATYEEEKEAMGR